MARTQTFRFGPGYLESIRLRVWTKPNRVSRGASVKYLGAEVVGSVDLATPVGMERVEVREFTSAWTSETDDVAQLVTAARAGDETAAVVLADQLVEWALEDWQPEHEAA